MNHDVFISYSSKNSKAAQAICHELEDNGIKCWMAPRDIPMGSKYASVITDAIVNSKVVVLIFSNYSARSVWVESEINIAFSNRKTIIPYKIDTTNHEDFKEFYLMLNNRHWIEAYPDYKTRFKELVAVVAQTLGKDISASKPAEPTPSPQPTPAPAPTPTRKSNYVKRYWWVALYVLFLGVAVWRLLPEKSVEPTVQTETEVISEPTPQVVVAKEPKDFTPKARETQQVQNKAKETQSVKSSTPKQSETKPTVSTQKATTTSTPKAEQKSAQTTTTQKADAKETKKDNDYLLNLPDSEFVSFKENDKYGYKLKSPGKVVIEPKYEYTWAFSEDLAWVVLNDKWGFIDKNGKEITPLKYDKVEPFRENIARVRLNGRWGYIDKTGKEIVRLIYNDAMDFKGELAAVKSNRKWGFIDKNGTVIITFKYDEIFSGFIGGYAGCKLNNKWGFIDNTGKEIIPFEYNAIMKIESSGGKFHRAEVYLNGERFYIDKNGNRVK